MLPWSDTDGVRGHDNLDARKAKRTRVGRTVADGAEDPRQRSSAEAVEASATGAGADFTPQELREDGARLVREDGPGPLGGAGGAKSEHGQRAHPFVDHGDREGQALTHPDTPLRHTWRKPTQDGRDPLADRRPEAGHVPVRRVLSPLPAREAADTFGLVAGRDQHGADQPHAHGTQRTDGAHAGHAPNAGAAAETHENRLELVVGVVGNRDEGATVLAGKALKGLVPAPSGLALGVAAPGRGVGIDEGE